MRKIITVLLVLAMLCSFSACGAATRHPQFEGNGFSTPDEAVQPIWTQ